MHLKRYTAPSMAAALQLIKKELGEDAVILANRDVRTSEGSSAVEVTAALDSPAPAANPRREVTPLPEQLSAFEGITGYVEGPVEETPLQASLRAHGVLPHIIEKVSAAAEALQTTDFSETDALQMVLSNLVPFTTGGKALEKNVAHLFLGPTGCGKTTTLCKLAVSKRVEGYSTGLITLDNLKVGAYEQLGIFAHAMKEEAFLAKDSTEFQRVLSTLPKKHYLFIDTAGFSPFSREQITRLKKKIEGLGIPAKLHLVLPANMNAMEMAAIPGALAHLHPESIIFTKTDETALYGGIANVAVMSGLKVCFVTDGQKVPSDIYEMDAATLASKLIKKPRLPWENA